MKRATRIIKSPPPTPIPLKTQTHSNSTHNFIVAQYSPVLVPPPNTRVNLVEKTIPLTAPVIAPRNDPLAVSSEDSGSNEPYSGILHINIILPWESPSPPLVHLCSTLANPCTGILIKDPTTTGDKASQSPATQPYSYLRSSRLRFWPPSPKSREQEANPPATSCFTTPRGAVVGLHTFSHCANLARFL